MKICAIVITYYPEIQKAIENIRQYLPYVDYLIIWENTPEIDRNTYKFDLLNYSNKITYMGTGKNEGISYPLNKVAEWAIKNGFSHMLTMDQDSTWDNFKIFRKLIESEKDQDTAIFAPQIIDSVRGINDFNNENQVITSGSIINLKHYAQIGPYCEDFVIDCVDTEYSFRVRLKHFKIKIIKPAKLYQSFGNLKKIRIFGCYHAHYSPFRIYHIVRNNIWMWRMYRNTDILPSKFFRNQILYWYIIREPLLTLLCSETKMKNLIALSKGLWDGIWTFDKRLKKLISR